MLVNCKGGTSEGAVVALKFSVGIVIAGGEAGGEGALADAPDEGNEFIRGPPPRGEAALDLFLRRVRADALDAGKELIRGPQLPRGDVALDLLLKEEELATSVSSRWSCFEPLGESLGSLAQRRLESACPEVPMGNELPRSLTSRLELKSLVSVSRLSRQDPS